MSKATFICEKCKSIKEVFFNTGEKPKTPICNNCKTNMKRKFGKVSVGGIIPDDIMYASHAMAYQSSKN